MANHRSVTLELRKDKPHNVYRYIYAWHQVPSGHHTDTYYLLLHALVQWGADRDNPVDVFSIAMQYSGIKGQNVDVTQPAHILEDDAETVKNEFKAFIELRKGKK